MLRRPEDVSYEELEPFIDIDPAELEKPFEFENDLSHFRWALGAAKTYRDTGLHLWETTSPGLRLAEFSKADRSTSCNASVRYSP